MTNNTKKITKIHKNGINYTLLALPNSNVFNYEVVQKIGALIEKDSKLYFPNIDKEIFGISHLIEHISFKHSKNMTSEEIQDNLKKYGRYNASTSHDRINYYFKTNIDNMDKAIQLVNEIAFNDLTNVGEEEFKLERDTVYNECKRYQDHPEHLFHFEACSKSYNLNSNDNVIGSLDNINSFELSDVIEVKKLFNMAGEQSINITFDNTLLTAQEVVEKIDLELIYQNVCLTERNQELITTYQTNLPKLVESQVFEIKSTTEQRLYANTFEIPNIDSRIVGYAVEYLNKHSKNSLFDEVREKRGLTYGIYMDKSRMAYKDYWEISCDITKGNEDKLVEAIKIACSETLNNFNQEDYNAFLTTKKINRDLTYLNLDSYESFLWLVNQIEAFKNPSSEPFNRLVEEDIDLYFDGLDIFITFDKVKEVLSIINDIIQSEKSVICWSK
jgi:predicted Zn-dependent peptidase